MISMVALHSPLLECVLGALSLNSYQTSRPSETQRRLILFKRAETRATE